MKILIFVVKLFNFWTWLLNYYSTDDHENGIKFLQKRKLICKILPVGPKNLLVKNRNFTIEVKNC